MNISSTNYEVGWTTNAVGAGYLSSATYEGESTMTLYPAHNESTNTNYAVHPGFFPEISVATVAKPLTGIWLMAKPIANAIKPIMPKGFIEDNQTLCCAGAIVLVLIITGVIFFWWKRRKKEEEPVETEVVQ
jgi:hypothetical protein